MKVEKVRGRDKWKALPPAVKRSVVDNVIGGLRIAEAIALGTLDDRDMSRFEVRQRISDLSQDRKAVARLVEKLCEPWSFGEVARMVEEDRQKRGTKRSRGRGSDIYE